MGLDAGEDDERLRGRAFFEDCARLHYENLVQSVVRYLRRKRGGGEIGRIEQDADDVVGEAFLKMIRGVSKSHPALLGHLRDFGFSARHPGVIRYMAKVCQYTVVDLYRRENRGGKLIPPDDPAAADQFWGMVERSDRTALEDADRDDDDPESHLLGSEAAEAARREVHEALQVFQEMRELGRIPNATWRVYQLVWKEQKSHDQAAEDLGRSKKVVQNQDAIIKKILRDIIAELRNRNGSDGHDD